MNPAQTNDGIHIIAAIRDISARVEIEDALRESEARLASTLNSIGEGVLATDLHGIVTRINPVAEQLTGFTREEAIGRHVDEIYHVLSEKTRQPVWTPVRALACGGATVAQTRAWSRATGASARSPRARRRSANRPARWWAWWWRSAT